MIEPDDQDIAKPLRLAGLPSGRSFVAAVRAQKNKRDKGLLAHAQTLAGLRAAVCALDVARRSLCNGQPAIACTVWADGQPAETLLDHIDTAIHLIGEGAPQ